METHEKNLQKYDDGSRNLISLIQVFENGLSRLQRFDDPKMRYALLLEKFCMLADFMYGHIDANSDKYPENIRDRVQNVTSKFQEEINSLSDWITSKKDDSNYEYNRHGPPKKN